MKLRFGIVGCGAISEEMHIPTLLACPEVELVALVDADRQHAERMAATHGIGLALQDLAEAGGKLDAVVVCTPPHVRPGIVARAFAMGLDVFSEKPLANTSAECATMVAAARDADRILAVSHQYRFFPVRRDLPDIAARHGLGRILSVDISEGAPYGWNLRSGYTFLRDQVSGGVVINAGVHSLDSLIQWFGDPVIDRYEDDSLGGLESNVRSSLVFPGGVTANFRISRTCRLSNLFRVRCEQGTIVFNNRTAVEYRVEAGGACAEHRLPDPAQSPQDCWRAQFEDFIHAVRDRRRPVVDGEEGSRVIALVDEMYRMKRGRPLSTSPPLPGATW